MRGRENPSFISQKKEILEFSERYSILLEFHILYLYTIISNLNLMELVLTIFICLYVVAVIISLIKRCYSSIKFIQEIRSYAICRRMNFFVHTKFITLRIDKWLSSIISCR